jgi:putative endonuclease
MPTKASAPKVQSFSENEKLFLLICVMYFVYILYSEKLNKYYKGYTNNIEERLIRHNKGYEMFTSRGVPWKLKLVLEKPTKREAILLENKLKNLNRKRLEEFMIRYGS